MKTLFQYDHYFNYEEMTEHLQTLQTMYPSLMKLESCAVTAEGRNIWSVTLSDESLRSPDEKPAFYMDGCTHAGEIAGSMACMYTIDAVLTNHDQPETAEMLKTQTLYFIPRISPDGTEEYLTTGFPVRSINHVYPDDRDADGINAADLNSDGKILTMRIRSDDGAWKKSSENDLIMTKRQPDEKTGEFYHVFTEGILKGDDTVSLKTARPVYSMDFNRNFPVSWQPEGRQPGAGKYPLDHIETKTMADFILSHRNIAAVLTMHTCGGFLIHPPGTMPKEKAESADMKLYRTLGKLADRKLKYRTFNLFDLFAVSEESFDAGAFDDWCYLNEGIPAITMEIWSLREAAGLKSDIGEEDSTDEEAEQDMRKITEWLQTNAPETIMPWTPFDHPQLGPVEIGGIDTKFSYQNPPARYLEAELDKILDFTLRYASVLPSIRLSEPELTQISESVFRVEATVRNTGFLSTWLSEQAKKLKNDRSPEISLSGAEILSEPQSVKGLSGFSDTPTGYWWGGNIHTGNHTPSAVRLTWIVKAEKGTEITLCASQERAGKDVLKLIL